MEFGWDVQSFSGLIEARELSSDESSEETGETSDEDMDLIKDMD
jgi:hypothetical protein